MSTKTLRKRIALVAVSALGFGLLSAAPSSATAAIGSVSPIRVSAGDATPNGQISWTVPTGSTYAGSETAVVTLTTAPSAAAVVTIKAIGDIGAPVVHGTAGIDGAASLGIVSKSVSGTHVTVAAGAAGSTAKLAISASVSGRYIGSIRVAGGAVDDTISFDFTTTGAVASYTFTSDVTATIAGGTIATTITLRDAAGNITQPSTVDTFALTQTTAAATAGAFAASGIMITDGDGATTSLFDGVATLDFVNSSTASSASVLTATPRGTLGTLAPQTLAVTTTAVSTFGTAVASVATSTTLAVAATGNIAATSTTAGMNAYTVDPSQTSVTFNVAGLTPSTAFTYDVTHNGTVSVAGNAAYASGTNLTAIASATGTASIVVVTTSPAAQVVTLDLNTADSSNDVAGQVNAMFTYATPVYVVRLTSPTTTNLTVSGSTLTYTGTITDQFGNGLGGATVTATGATAVGSTAGTALTAVTASTATGAFTVSLTPLAATTIVTTTFAAVKTGAGFSSAVSHVTNLTATGIAATLVLSDNDGASGSVATDGVGSRTVPLAPGNRTGAGVAAADNWVGIRPQTTSPGSIAYSVTATNGIRLSLTSPSAGTVITTAQTAALTSTGATAFYATPTQVGTGVITVVSGGLTQTFTLTGTLSASANAQLVSLTPGTNANGKAAFTVTTTDIFGNVVDAEVNISMSGAGYLSNGFKNMTLTTLATSGSNII